MKLIIFSHFLPAFDFWQDLHLDVDFILVKSELSLKNALENECIHCFFLDSSVWSMYRNLFFHLFRCHQHLTFIIFNVPKHRISDFECLGAMKLFSEFDEFDAIMAFIESI